MSDQEPGDTPRPGPPLAVRHFFWTRGCTTPSRDLDRLTILYPGTPPRNNDQITDAAQIYAWCAQDPRAVSELAALLGRPLQIVKVTLAALLDAGTLTVWSTGRPMGTDALERLLDALRTL